MGGAVGSALALPVGVSVGTDGVVGAGVAEVADGAEVGPAVVGVGVGGAIVVMPKLGAVLGAAVGALPDLQPPSNVITAKAARNRGVIIVPPSWPAMLAAAGTRCHGAHRRFRG